MIILASATIVSLNNTGIIDRASEATFKEDVRNYQAQLSLYLGEELSKNPRLDTKSINATQSTTPSITDIIKTMNESHVAKFEVQNGELIYVGVEADEATWVTELGVGVRGTVGDDSGEETVLTKEQYETKYATEIAAAASYGTYSNNVYTVTSAVPAGTKIALAYGTTTIQGGEGWQTGTPRIPDYNNVIFPSTLTTIGDYAFAYTESTSVVIPSGVTSIGQAAFYSADGAGTIETVSLPDGLVSIGSGAFYAAKISEIDLPETIRTLGNESLGGCTNLTSITIPEGVTDLYQVFFLNSNLETITLPKSLEKIGHSFMGPGTELFYGCSKLKTINYRGSETEFNQIELYYEMGDGSVPTWPTGVTYVYNYAG